VKIKDAGNQDDGVTGPGLAFGAGLGGGRHEKQQDDQSGQGFSEHRFSPSGSSGLTALDKKNIVYIFKFYYSKGCAAWGRRFNLSIIFVISSLAGGIFYHESYKSGPASGFKVILSLKTEGYRDYNQGYRLLKKLLMMNS
jgi:hypothetical protein